MKRLIPVIALLMTLMLLCGALTACKDTKAPVVINPVDEENSTGAQSVLTTLPIPADHLRVTDLLWLNDGGLRWTDLSETYTYTETGERSAEFPVVMDNDMETVLTLEVTYDETGVITWMVARYGENYADMLMNDDGKIVELLQAIKGDQAQ